MVCRSILNKPNERRCSFCTGGKDKMKIFKIKILLKTIHGSQGLNCVPLNCKLCKRDSLIKTIIKQTKQKTPSFCSLVNPGCVQEFGLTSS